MYDKNPLKMLQMNKIKIIPKCIYFLLLINPMAGKILKASSKKSSTVLNCVNSVSVIHVDQNQNSV